MATPTEPFFDRLPRPQRVLNPGRLSVPTASALLKEHARVKSGRQTPLAVRRSVPPSSPTIRNAEVTTSSRPLETTTPPSLSLVTSHEAPAVELQSLQHSVVQTLGPMVTLGTFTQDKTKWIVRAQRGRKSLVMVKRLSQVAGQAEASLLRELSHRNIARLVHSYMEHEVRCIALEYCRFTVAEILHVHLRLEEPQLQLIARSVSRTTPSYDNA
jgi:hypothetical protein